MWCVIHAIAVLGTYVGVGTSRFYLGTMLVNYQLPTNSDLTCELHKQEIDKKSAPQIWKNTSIVCESKI